MSRMTTQTFLAGGGDTGQQIRDFDWSSSPLGQPQSWSPSLKTLVSVMLGSVQAMFVAWGPQRIMLYNDGYAELCRDRHPDALGKPFAHVWFDIMDDVGPILDRAFAGHPTRMDDIQFTILRDGRPQETHFAFSYTPVRDDHDVIAGMFCACTETTNRVLAERERLSTVDRLRRMFEQAPSFAIGMSGPSHVIEFVNGAHRALFGSLTWVGQTIRDAFPDIAGQGFYELLDRVYATGERYVVAAAPVRFRPAGGGAEEERLLDFIYEPMRDQAGNVTGIFCEGHDVTDKHQADIALRLSEGRFRAAVDAVEGVLWTNNSSGQMEDEQPGWAALTGQTYEEYKGHGWAKAVHPNDAEPTINAWNAAVRTRQIFSFEHRLRRHDGEWRIFRIRAIPTFDANGELHQWVGVHTDVTDLRQTELALRKLNAELETRVADAIQERRVLAEIVEGTDAFVQVVGSDYTWLAINRAAADEFERIFGVRPRVGANMLGTLAGMPQHRADVERAWAKALAGEAYTAVGEFGDPGRDRRHYEMRFNVLRDAEGQRIGAYQFVYDVTDRIRAAEQLARVNDQLRQSQKLEAVGQLTGGIAHDFNNLLMIVQAGLNLLARKDDKAQREQLVGQMRDAVVRGTNLTKQLLAFSRKQALEPEPTDFVRLMTDMADLLDRSLGTAVDVRLDLPSDLDPVFVDPNALQLAILNLAVNARDAMPNGGAITIKAGNGSHSNPTAPCVHICVVDEGTGMSKAVQARIFEPFFTTKEVGKGSGLGLAQVHGFAEQSGGHMEVSSVEGQGTTMTLVLPRSIVPPAAPRQPINLGPARMIAKGGQALLVEDDDEVAALVEDMLMHLGWQVTRAANAKAALGALADGREVNLIFSDVMMPGGMNGLELALEARRRRPKLPVVLTSGYADAVRHEADKANVPLLPKPYSLDRLAAVLDAAVRLGSAM